ncbi:predicted protein [Histoplasma capsulatum var. duboisii H88]|uniref:Predicted protein n=2 Tax=Ajellomyces capsulatus TaxID=5037 RepID=F0UD74_AJEC8|nr:predicted protein [Histoplasma capsulatum H143]EGC42669.1 predicted protein [Histoplasma capsulatum var. duboisii H88]
MSCCLLLCRAFLNLAPNAPSLTNSWLTATASEQCPPRLRCINPIRGNLGASNAGEWAPSMQPCNHGWQAAAEGPKPPTDGLVFGLAMLGAFYELLQLPRGGLERLQLVPPPSNVKQCPQVRRGGQAGLKKSAFARSRQINGY